MNVLNTAMDAHGRFRGSVLDQAGGLVVLAAFVALGPSFGPAGAIVAGVMTVVGIIASPMLCVGLVEAVREGHWVREPRA